MATHADKIRDWGMLVACNLIWASQFALVKLVQREVGPVFATAFPMLLATVMMVPVVWWRGRARPRRLSLRVGDVVGFAVIGVCGQVAAQLFVTWGMRHTSAANGALIQLALPVVTAAMALFLLRERMTRVRWLAFALAIAGVVACSLNDLRGFDLGTENLTGNLLVLGGVVGSAFYNVYSKKLLVRFSPLEVLLGSYVFVSLVLSPLSLWLEPASWRAFPTLSGQAWLGLALLAGLQYFLSMVIFLSVLSRLAATQAALSNYMIPFFGVVLAWLVLGETLGLVSLLGGALVLGSTWLATAYEDAAGDGVAKVGTAAALGTDRVA